MKTRGQQLYERWCRSTGSGTAGYFRMMNAVEQRRWERLAAVSDEMVEAALDAWHDPLPSEMSWEQEEREGMRAALEAALVVPSEAARKAEREGGEAS